MKYEATILCQSLKDCTKVIGPTVPQEFDTLEAVLKQLMRVFEVDAGAIEVVEGRWEFTKQEATESAPEYLYTVKVQRVDPVLPSELRRELEKLGC